MEILNKLFSFYNLVQLLFVHVSSFALIQLDLSNILEKMIQILQNFLRGKLDFCLLGDKNQWDVASFDHSL